MDHEEEPVAEPDEDGFDDVYGEAPAVDEYQLSTRPGVVSDGS